MKTRKIIIILIISVMLIATIYNMISKDITIINEKQIIKEMMNTEYESEITQLNKSHEEYVSQVKSNKEQIALAITEMGIETLKDSTIETIVANIKNIKSFNKEDEIVFFENGSWQNTDILTFNTYNTSINGNNLIVGKTQGSGIYATSLLNDTSYNYIVVECENIAEGCQFGSHVNGTLPYIISEGTKRLHYNALTSKIYFIPNNVYGPIFFGNSVNPSKEETVVKRIYACKIN